MRNANFCSFNPARLLHNNVFFLYPLDGNLFPYNSPFINEDPLKGLCVVYINIFIFKLTYCLYIYFNVN